MTLKNYIALGLMSGTSGDGIDVSIIATDGINYIKPLGFESFLYNTDFKERLIRCASDNSYYSRSLELELTNLHIKAVKSFLRKIDIKPDIIGFHGHTIFHDPKNKITWQIGDGKVLSKETSINVVYNFRKNDVKNGGQGAPLIPIYHRSLFSSLKKPLLILNIGGVSNFTFLGTNNDIIASDTGPGNAIIDDLMRKHFDLDYDNNGSVAKKGVVNQELTDKLLLNEFFNKIGPKSLDRNDFSIKDFNKLNATDAVSTATYFTAAAIAKSLQFLPEIPKEIVICGGGRKNSFLIKSIESLTNLKVTNSDSLGINGDSIEAEGFAYLAVRSKKGLPISFPGTTGVKNPLSGGVYVQA